MPKVEVDIDYDCLDNLILDDLKESYRVAQEWDCKDKKLLKALKRVIEYYGGEVDE